MRNPRIACLPSGRELSLFLAWTLFVGLLIFLAKTYLGPKAWKQADQPEEAAVEGIEFAPIEIADPTAIQLPKPAVRKPARVSQPKPTAAPKLRPPLAKNGWSPDGEERPGDARIVQPEEIKWLQDRLALVPLRTDVSIANPLSTLNQLAGKVGRIPYAVQTHGWGLPVDTLEANQGDCQDKSLLLAEGLLAAGIQEVAICIGVEPGYQPGESGHAWVQARIGQTLWRIEATSGQVYKAGSGGPLDDYEPSATVWHIRKAD